MTTHEKDKIIAAANECHHLYSEWHIDIERFYAIAFEDGAARLEQERDQLREALEIAYDNLLVHWSEEELQTVGPLNKISQALAATESRSTK